MGLLRSADVFFGMPKPPTVRNTGLSVTPSRVLQLLDGMDASCCGGTVGMSNVRRQEPSCSVA